MTRLQSASDVWIFQYEEMVEELKGVRVVERQFEFRIWKVFKIIKKKKELICDYSCNGCVIIPRHEVEGGYRFRCRPSVRHSVIPSVCPEIVSGA